MAKQNATSVLQAAKARVNGTQSRAIEKIFKDEEYKMEYKIRVVNKNGYLSYSIQVWVSGKQIYFDAEEDTNEQEAMDAIMKAIREVKKEVK